MTSCQTTSWANSCSQTVLGVVAAGVLAFSAVDCDRVITQHSNSVIPLVSCNPTAHDTHYAGKSITCPRQTSATRWDKSTEKDIVMPTDELSANIIAIIGEHGAIRFNSFKDYPEGWGGDGHKLSFASVGAMTYFVNIFKGTIHNPSIFMTRLGNIQLGWDTTSNGYVELEFFPDHIECYFEKDDSEKYILAREIHQLSTLIA